MNSALFRPVIVALLLIGLTGGFLKWRGPQQRLGPAGVKLRFDPLQGGAAALQRTNAILMPERLTARLGHQYESRNENVDPYELLVLPTDTGFGRRRYRDEADHFEALLTVVLMGTDRASLHRPELCLPAQGVSLVYRNTLRLPTEDGEVEVLQCHGQVPRTAEPGSENRRIVFAYFFLASDRQTSSHTARQFISMRDLIWRGEMPRWAMVTCTTSCWVGEENATFEKMKHFLAVAIPAIRAKPPAPKS